MEFWWKHEKGKERSFIKNVRPRQSFNATRFALHGLVSMPSPGDYVLCQSLYL